MSEIVGHTELRKREDENKTEGNWGQQGPTFRLPFTFASSPLSESLEQAIARVSK